MAFATSYQLTNDKKKVLCEAHFIFNKLAFLMLSINVEE